MSPASSYGHDVHGVNIQVSLEQADLSWTTAVQNLRALSTGRAKALPGGFRTENDWKQEAHEAVVVAENEKTMSRSLRDASRRLDEDLKQRVETEEQLVEAALRRRIAKTTELQSLVEAAIQNTDAERGNLTSSLQKLQDRAKNIRKKIDLTESRVKCRFDRPTREMVNDTLQLQLKKQRLMLQSYLSGVESRAKAAGNNIARLERIRHLLQKDLDAKAEAVEIDTKVLQGDVQERAVSEFTAAAVQPHQWTRQTEQTIKEASRLARETEHCRQETRQMLRENETRRKDFAEVLNQSMLEKLNETEGLKQCLESKLDELQKEIDEAKMRKAALEQSLRDKRAPLERATQRLSLRTRRPRHECVNDEAHRALMGEVHHITAITNTLKAKIAAVEQKIRQLEAQRDALRGNIDDKQRSWKVDEACAMLDGRLTLAHAPASVWSAASSVRSFGSRRSSNSRATSVSTQKSEILDRISKLEADVATARDARVALEEKVAALHST